MTMTLTYDFDGNEYEYELGEDQLIEALHEWDEDTDLEDACGDPRFVEFCHEYFYDDVYDAMSTDWEWQAQINEYEEYRRDPYLYYGVSESDFH